MSQMMTVSSLNTKIKSLLEATFMHIMVEGEIAQVTYASSGHVYFSIKDNQSTLKCVMWKSAVARLKFQLAKGEHIVVEGSVGVYTPRGEYQFIATHIEPYGKGALAVAFEQLKTKLKTKGYFDTHTKKPLPKYPNKIAIVTAGGAAALQDMLRVAEKRWAVMEIVVVDVLVQGALAAGEIARGIRYADGLKADMIIVGRGGGSTEDLWAFNEELVADAIYEAETAVVSAVGHEVDTVISDFVADLRAPTPSAAMEMVLPDGDELRYMLDERLGQFDRRVGHILSQKSQQTQSLYAELSRFSLGNRLDLLYKQFDRLALDFGQTMQYRLSQFDAMRLPIVGKLEDTMGFVLRNKSKELESTLTRFGLSNPHTQMREAWAQVTRDGKKVGLEMIEVGDQFDLLSDSVKIKVKALEKKSL
jgi:exodeoxyribonuclease VII large subunit